MENDFFNDPKNQAILASRKAILAQKSNNLIKQYNQELLLFRVDNIQRFGLAFELVDRVISSNTLTFIPGIPKIFLGVFHYNSEIWPVVDTGQLLGTEKSGKPSYYILCKQGSWQLAFAVQDILGECPYIDTEELDHLLDKSYSETNFLKGIYQTDVAIINLSAIFKSLFEKNL